jgi:hypothetical protein
MSPTPFETITAKRFNFPAYFVGIEGVTDRQFSTHTVQGAVLNKVVCMQRPRGAAQKLSPLQGSATVGELKIRLVDVDGELTRIVSTEVGSPVLDTLINKKLTLWAGYRDLQEADFVARFGGEIRNVKLVDSLLYEFTVADFKRRYEDRLMAGLDDQPTTAIEGLHAIGSSSLELKSVTGIESGQTLIVHRKDGSQAEAFTAGAVDEQAKTVGIFPDTGVAWTTGDTVVADGVRIRGNIINVFYSLLTGTFSTDPTDAFPLASVLGTPGGLTLVDADLDLAALTRTRDRFLADFDVDFIFRASVTARRFFEDEIFPLGFYPTVANDGILGIRSFVPPGPEDPTPPVLEEQHMDGIPAWDRKFKTHINEIRVFGDHDLGGGAEDLELHFQEDTADQAATRELGAYSVVSEGLRTGLEGAAIAEELGNRIDRRWRVPPIEIKAKTLFTKRDLQVGTIVSLTHPSVPDTFADVVGVTDRLMEITRVDLDYVKGRVKLELLETGFGRFMWLGPAEAGQPTYPTADAAQRRFHHWGDSANKVNGGAEDGYTVF